jgi:3-deoxy-manno-octulosonate cytidylyltransferase (CMP-KDO synthetase)
MGGVLAVIPARYGSTRLLGKPLALMRGKPMIQHVVEGVRRAKRVTEVVVATDDQRIVDAVAACGAKALMTDPAARSGTDRVAEVAFANAQTVVINIQGDEPLVHPEMVDMLAAFLEQNQDVPMASLMTRLRRAEDLTNPNVVKVVVDREGFALYFSRAPIPWQRANPPTRPAMEYVYKHLGIYGYQRDFVLRFPKLPPTELEQLEQLEQLRALEHGHRIKMLETPHETFGVDTADDLATVERKMGTGANFRGY